MRKLQGIIVSDKMNKTRVVRSERMQKHSRYDKYYTVSKKFKAHDEQNKYKTGERVIIQETKPMSKEKRWKIVARV